MRPAYRNWKLILIARVSRNEAKDINKLPLLQQLLSALKLLDSGVSEVEVAAKFKDLQRAEALMHFLKESELVNESNCRLTASDTCRYLLREYGIA